MQSDIQPIREKPVPFKINSTIALTGFLGLHDFGKTVDMQF